MTSSIRDCSYHNQGMKTTIIVDANTYHEINKHVWWETMTAFLGQADRWLSGVGEGRGETNKT